MIGMLKFTSNKKIEWSCNVRLNQVGRQTLFFFFFLDESQTLFLIMCITFIFIIF